MEPLTQEQIIWVRRQVSRWIHIADKHGYTDRMGRPLTPADADHSALLWRLLSGKEPLPEPPPLVCAYPDYPD